MRFGKLRSVGHNVADSLASGIGLMIGIYQMDIFAEAAATPEGYIDVDFLTGLAAGADASSDVVRVAKLYSEALPGLCERHGVDVAEFRALKARFTGRRYFERFTVRVEDRHGRLSVDEYVGRPGRRVKVLDHLGRVRPKSSR